MFTWRYVIKYFMFPSYKGKMVKQRSKEGEMVISSLKRGLDVGDGGDLKHWYAVKTLH